MQLKDVTVGVTGAARGWSPPSPGDIWPAVRFVRECDHFSGRTLDVDGGFSF